MCLSRLRGIVLFVVLFSSALLLFCPLPRIWRLGWRSEVLDFGHVPLFASMTIGIYYGVGVGLVRASLVSILLAGLAEVIQHFVGRSASFQDFAYGIAGVCSAVGLVLTWKLRRFYWLGLSVVSILGPILRSGPILIDAYEGYQQFPILAQFDSDHALQRWTTQQAELILHRNAEDPSQTSARLVFLPGPQAYSSATLMPIRRDLSEYRWLCSQLRVEQESLDLVLSIRGGPDESGHTSHYQVIHRLAPGVHILRLDMPAVATLAQPRSLDLRDLWFIQLFIVSPREPQAIALQRIWLEK